MFEPYNFGRSSACGLSTIKLPSLDDTNANRWSVDSSDIYTRKYEPIYLSLAVRAVTLIAALRIWGSCFSIS